MNTIQSLNGKWRLYQVIPEGTGGKAVEAAAGAVKLKHALAGNGREYLAEADVPGTVLGTLLREGLIEDPYWRCNEYAVRELMTRDYRLERDFEAEDFCGAFAELVCEGLDTIAEISLNGMTAARVDDMHRTFRIPVNDYLRPGNNRISVYFYSALNAARKEDDEDDIFYASTGCIHGNAVIRKAHYMFGWDWGPQLPDAGIFRNISIEYTRGPKIQDFRIRQKHRIDGSVELKLEVDVSLLQKELPAAEAAPTQNELPAAETAPTQNELPAVDVTPTPKEMLAEIRIEGPDGSLIWENTEAFPMRSGIHPGVCHTEFTHHIQTPQFWWPNGVGEQPLYRVSFCLKDRSGNGYDRIIRRIGLRTITVCTDSHEYGSEFAFAVNGVKIFAMGANYVPEDSLLDRVNRERTKRLISDCKRANFNCIRVWGGGFYPDDYFYDACDEAGLLVWQDLMFACNVYALNDHFEENITAETKDNVKRLRHHACLALWCGNNEMEWGWADEWARIKGHHPRYKADYTKIFEYILPKALKSCDDETFFWPSSPSSGGSYDDPNAVNRGDQHYWEVWHSGKPFTEYRKDYFSFCSEYGFQSFPCMKTIRSFAEAEDLNIFSEVMESHQKNGAANGKILNYVADYFLYPKDLDSLAYISQVLQLKAIQYGVEHWRRNRGRCMGSLYWQLNDCWPVASWAGIDYYGRWKALHYGARRFYSPVMVSACEKEELSTEIAYYVHNDTREFFAGRLEAALIDTDLTVLWKAEQEVWAEGMTAAKVFETDYGTWIPAGKDLREIFSRVRLYDGDTIISERVTLFVKPKHFHYPGIKYEVTAWEDGERFGIRVSGPRFAQYVELEFTEADAVFSDNFFDLTEAAGHLVYVEKKELPENFTLEMVKSQVRVRSAADTYVSGRAEQNV